MAFVKVSCFEKTKYVILLGSLSGADSSQKVTEENKGNYSFLKGFTCGMVINCFTVRKIFHAVVLNAGHTDPMVFEWKSHRLTNKRYLRDNRLIIF